jgi:predicted deacylase
MKKEVQIVSSTKLQVDESLNIKRCRYWPDQASEKKLSRICIVSGIHGDELEGQYICYELARRMMLEPERLSGIVDLYPGMNPLGIDSITRGFPGYDLDMNRIFPGRQGNTMIESVANNIVESLLGADLVIDYHASNMFLDELPQARIAEAYADQLLPFAKQLNLDLLWVHPAATVLESTLSHSLNTKNTACVVVEAGIGMRITKHYGDQLVDGIFSLMTMMGIWKEDKEAIIPVRQGILSTDYTVSFLNANTSGVFIPEVAHCSQMKTGQVIGKIVDPLEAKVLEVIRAESDGLLFTLRQYPIVYEGSLLGRLISYVPKESKGDIHD